MSQNTGLNWNFKNQWPYSYKWLNSSESNFKESHCVNKVVSSHANFPNSFIISFAVPFWPLITITSVPRAVTRYALRTQELLLTGSAPSGCVTSASCYVGLRLWCNDDVYSGCATRKGTTTLLSRSCDFKLLKQGIFPSAVLLLITVELVEHGKIIKNQINVIDMHFKW